MQATNFWHRFYLHRGKVILHVLLFLLPFYSRAQYSIYENDLKYANKPFHFGVTLGFNESNFKITLDSAFIAQNKILNVKAVNGPGFNLGIISDLHLSKYFDLRFIPDLSFAEKDIDYTLKDSTGIVVKKIQSVYLDFPVHIKYKSKPYKDMRLYIISGFKYSIDMQSNASARKAENLVKVNQMDYAFEYGMGIEFHLPLVIISPEIKVSYGLTNVLAQDNKLIYSYIFQVLRARGILFSVHFEG
jgi:hypothetical protein